MSNLKFLDVEQPMIMWHLSSDQWKGWQWWILCHVSSHT